MDSPSHRRHQPTKHNRFRGSFERAGSLGASLTLHKGLAIDAGGNVVHTDVDAVSRMCMSRREIVVVGHMHVTNTDV